MKCYFLKLSKSVIIKMDKIYVECSERGEIYG